MKRMLLIRRYLKHLLLQRDDSKRKGRFILNSYMLKLRDCYERVEMLNSSLCPLCRSQYKIRQRKLEVSKQASSLNIYYADYNDSLEVNKLDYSDKHVQSADRGEEKHPEEFQDKDMPLIYEKSNHLDAVNVDTDPSSSSFQHESYVANTVLDEESKSACVTPPKDTQTFC